MAATIESLSGTIDEIFPGVVADRRWLHQHPELGYQEFQTSAFVAERLQSLGVEDIHTGVGQTGVTGLIHGGLGAGKVVALRADMDALPILEENEVDYASQSSGVMHACGHDGHTAMLLGTVRALTELRGSFAGTVKLLFQPAEEGGQGAKAMISAGALENPRPDAVFGIHLWNGIPVGEVWVRDGTMMVGVDAIEIKVIGAGGHGGIPNISIDPIVAAAAVVMNVQSLISRNNNPLEPGVFTIGSIHAGNAGNVIPDVVTMTGAIRHVNEQQAIMMRRRIAEIAEATAAAYGARAEVTVGEGVGPTVNDPAIAQIVRDASAEVVGPDRVVPGQILMVSEDVSEFMNVVPGCYYLVGSMNETKGFTWGHHTSRFDIDEDALAIGIKTMTRSVLRFLSGA
jgi:amidohydrolase